jgi:hypothetical protein
MKRSQATEQPEAQAVTAILVRALGDHEHDGGRHAAGAEFPMTPEAAELAIARGDVTPIDSEAQP